MPQLPNAVMAGWRQKVRLFIGTISKAKNLHFCLRELGLLVLNPLAASDAALSHRHENLLSLKAVGRLRQPHANPAPQGM